MKAWVIALAIVLFCEGAMVAIMPQKWQETMRQITEMPPQVLRRVGSIMVAAAFLIVALMLWSES